MKKYKDLILPNVLNMKLHSLNKLMCTRNPLIRTDIQMKASKKQFTNTIKKYYKQRGYAASTMFLEHLIKIEKRRLDLNELYDKFEYYINSIANRFPDSEKTSLISTVWNIVLQHAFKQSEQNAIILLDEIIDHNIKTLTKQEEEE